MIKVNCDMCGNVIEVKTDALNNKQIPKIKIDKPDSYLKEYEVCLDCIKKIEGGLNREKTEDQKQ